MQHKLTLENLSEKMQLLRADIEKLKNAAGVDVNKSVNDMVEETDIYQEFIFNTNGIFKESIKKQNDKGVEIEVSIEEQKEEFIRCLKTLINEYDIDPLFDSLTQHIKFLDVLDPEKKVFSQESHQKLLEKHEESYIGDTYEQAQKYTSAQILYYGIGLDLIAIPPKPDQSNSSEKKLDHILPATRKAMEEYEVSNDHTTQIGKYRSQAEDEICAELAKSSNPQGDSDSINFAKKLISLNDHLSSFANVYWQTMLVCKKYDSNPESIEPKEWLSLLIQWDNLTVSDLSYLIENTPQLVKDIYDIEMQYFVENSTIEYTKKVDFSSDYIEIESTPKSDEDTSKNSLSLIKTKTFNLKNPLIITLMAMSGAIIVGALFILAAIGVLPLPEAISPLKEAFSALPVEMQTLVNVGIALAGGMISALIGFAGIKIANAIQNSHSSVEIKGLYNVNKHLQPSQIASICNTLLPQVTKGVKLEAREIELVEPEEEIAEIDQDNQPTNVVPTSANVDDPIANPVTPSAKPISSSSDDEEQSDKPHSFQDSSTKDTTSDSSGENYQSLEDPSDDEVLPLEDPSEEEVPSDEDNGGLNYTYKSPLLLKNTAKNNKVEGVEREEDKVDQSQASTF